MLRGLPHTQASRRQGRDRNSLHTWILELRGLHWDFTRKTRGTWPQDLAQSRNVARNVARNVVRNVVRSVARHVARNVVRSVARTATYAGLPPPRA